MHSLHYENDLIHEFPQYREQMHRLKIADTRFRKLFEEYDTLSKELHRIENEVETPADVYVEQRKKRRLALKDEIYAMLKQAA